MNGGNPWKMLFNEGLLSLFLTDVGRLQVSADFEKDAESQARHDAIVRLEIAQNANQILGPAMEEIQHENHVSHLHQSQAQTQR